MRKLLVMIFCLFLIMLSIVIDKNLISAVAGPLSLSGNEKIEIYLTEEPDLKNTKILKALPYFIVEINFKSYKDIKNEIKQKGYKISAEAIVLSKNDYSTDSIIEKLNLNVLKVASLNSDLTLYDAYCSKFSLNANTKFNVQIASDKNTIKIGSPLILGSF